MTRRPGRTARRARGMIGLLTLVVVLITALALVGGRSVADEPAGHDHLEHPRGMDDELAEVRRATARFHRVEEALAAGYELGWVNGSGTRIVTGCVSHASAGAMGYHYFQPELMADLAVDPLEPEALVYAPGDDGRLKLVAVEWVVRGPRTNPPGASEPPSVLGRQMHVLVPAVGFYITHAWLWRANPSGMFADWNPKVTCS